MQEVRFGLLSLEVLSSLPSHILDIEEIRVKVQEARKYVPADDRPYLQRPQMFFPRGLSEVVMIINEEESKHANPNKVLQTVSYYDPVRNKLHHDREKISDHPFKHEYVQFGNQGVIGKYVYAVRNGKLHSFDEPRENNYLFRYDPQTRTWAEMARMRHNHIFLRGCSSPSALFVFGGQKDLFDNESASKAVETYSPELNSWDSLPELPYEVNDEALCYYDNALFVSGGRPNHPSNANYDSLSKKLYRLKLDCTTWEALSPMQWNRDNHIMTAIEGKLYVVGGNDRYAYYERYDISLDQWTNLSLPIPDLHLSGFWFRSCTTIGSKIVFLQYGSSDYSSDDDGTPSDDATTDRQYYETCDRIDMFILDVAKKYLINHDEKLLVHSRRDEIVCTIPLPWHK